MIAVYACTRRCAIEALYAGAFHESAPVSCRVDCQGGQWLATKGCRYGQGFQECAGQDATVGGASGAATASYPETTGDIRAGRAGGAGRAC